MWLKWSIVLFFVGGITFVILYDYQLNPDAPRGTREGSSFDLQTIGNWWNQQRPKRKLINRFTTQINADIKFADVSIGAGESVQVLWQTECFTTSKLPTSAMGKLTERQLHNNVSYTASPSLPERVVFRIWLFDAPGDCKKEIERLVASDSFDTR